MSKTVPFQTFRISTHFKSKYTVLLSKTFLFQVIQFSHTVLIQIIQFSVSKVSISKTVLVSTVSMLKSSISNNSVLHKYVV